MKDIGIADADIQKVLDRNGFKPPQNSCKSARVLDSPTSLYRHFDADGNLLYVGISLSAIERLRAHREQSHWFEKIAFITVNRYQTRHKAEIAEDMAISLEKPLHNIRRSGAPDHNLFDPEEAQAFAATVRSKIAENFKRDRAERLANLRAKAVR